MQMQNIFSHGCMTDTWLRLRESDTLVVTLCLPSNNAMCSMSTLEQRTAGWLATYLTSNWTKCCSRILAKYIMCNISQENQVDINTSCCQFKIGKHAI